MPHNEQPIAEQRKILAILNHRGEDLGDLPGWLHGRGWEVRTSTGLPESNLLLQNEINAAIVLPLTLKRDGVEWSSLLPALSPHTEIPWLVYPWDGAGSASISNLLMGTIAVADWFMPNAGHTEIESRLENLLRFKKMVVDNHQHTTELESQLVTDHKTGLFNDRHFRQRLREEFERSTRHGSPLALMLLDIDDFKDINDKNSYEFGDIALKTIANVLRDSVRAIDIPARIGGDEFALILPTTTIEEALMVGKRFQDSLRKTPAVDDSDIAQLRTSIGIATTNKFGGRDSRQLFLQANEALKISKQYGKNRIAFFDPNTRQVICNTKANEVK
ncbi:MAG: GGDEF domain-containing protein [Planctomycetota bacterium]|jgi:diguanylate cyclase (GGDEF)-like protein|nr:GGDEF domain-containing protein [Planctomycetota bacterium]